MASVTVQGTVVASIVQMDGRIVVAIDPVFPSEDNLIVIIPGSAKDRPVTFGEGTKVFVTVSDAAS